MDTKYRFKIDATIRIPRGNLTRDEKSRLERLGKIWKSDKISKSDRVGYITIKTTKDPTEIPTTVENLEELGQKLGDRVFYLRIKPDKVRIEVSTNDPQKLFHHLSEAGYAIKTSSINRN